MMKQERMRGITILELLFVIAIMAVIMGFASLGVDMVRNERVSSATKELFADLQKARMNAQTGNARGYGIRFESDTTYVLFTFTDCDNDYSYDVDACAGASREETEAVVKQVPPSVALKKTNPTTDFNNNILIFDRSGLPRSSSWAMGWMTIVVKNDSDQNAIKCVSVSTNRIRDGVWGWDKKEKKYACLEY